MHCALILAGLTALVAAAPIKTVDEIKHVSHRSYGQYDSYLMAADKEAAKMQMDVKDTTNMKRDLIEMADHVRHTTYPSNPSYTSYGPGALVVEEAAARMDMIKRHEMIEAADLMMADSIKRDMMDAMMDPTIDGSMMAKDNIKRSMDENN